MEIPVPPFITDEESGDEYQADMSGFVAEPEPPAEPPSTANKSSNYHVIQSVSYAPLLPARAADYAERTDLIQDRQTASQIAMEPQEVDIAVEERPVSDFALSTEELIAPIEVEPVPAAELQPAPAPPSSPEVAPAAVETPVAASATMMSCGKSRRELPSSRESSSSTRGMRTPGMRWALSSSLRAFIRTRSWHISRPFPMTPSKSLYYHHLGLVYACEGRDEDAIGAFQRVIEIDPDYSLAHATLGGYYRKLGLEELAQKHIGKAMKNIFDSENEYNRACLEAICGNADQAIELLGVALKNKQTYVDWILRDPDLDFIRQDPRFKQMISDYTR